jgi:hypothetical protein
MKNLSFFFAACGLALLTNATPAQAQYQPTPPPVYTSCAPSASGCWADTGHKRGISFGNNNTQAACEAEGQRANTYANYYRAQPQTPDNQNLVLYWDYYADGIFVGYYPSYPTY